MYDEFILATTVVDLLIDIHVFLVGSFLWTGLLDWNTGLAFDPKIAHKRLNLASYSLVGQVLAT